MTKKSHMSNSDRALSQLIYARDCIAAGRLLRATQAIRAAIELIGKQDSAAIDAEVLRLIGGGND